MKMARSMDTVRKSAITDHLKCPICLEVYRSPRSLSCLHTFCEHCLSSVIEKTTQANKITCPVCRKTTSPPSLNKPVKEWAKSLPMNYALLSLLESLENESESIKCQPCRVGGKIRVAGAFCVDCKEYQCQGCSIQHNRYKASACHKIARIGEIKKGTPTLDLGGLENCDVHPSKKIEFFCMDHNKLLCSTCSISGHRHCKRLEEVGKMGDTLMSGREARRLSDNLQSTQTNFDEIAKKLESNKAELCLQNLSVKRDVKVYRNDMILQLDRTVEYVTSESERIRSTEHAVIAEKIKSVRTQSAAVASSRSLLDSVLKSGSRDQIFIAFCKSEEQLLEYNSKLRETKATTNRVDISLDLNGGPPSKGSSQQGSGISQQRLSAKVAVSRKRLYNDDGGDNFDALIKRQTFNYHLK